MGLRCGRPAAVQIVKGAGAGLRGSATGQEALGLKDARGELGARGWDFGGLGVRGECAEQTQGRKNKVG